MRRSSVCTGARAPSRHQEGLDRLRRALRPGDRIAGICQGVGDPSHRRVSQDRAGGDRRWTVVEDDEARRRHATTGSRNCSTSIRSEAGKEQYLIPYFIAAHPGTRDQDMLELALWLKKNGFRADQVQAFLPSPMATATAMYHSGKNPLKRVGRAQRRGRHPEGHQGAPPAQGIPALSRSGELAGAARGIEAHGPRGFDRQRQTAPHSRLPADRDPRAGRRPAPPGSAAVSNAAHGIAQVGRSAQGRRPAKASRCPEQAGRP